MAFHLSPCLAVALLSVTGRYFSTMSIFSLFNTETNAVNPPFFRRRK